MSEYQFTPEALQDLLDIWNFIAADNIEAADRVEAAIFQACGLLGKSPSVGMTRRDLTSRRFDSGLSTRTRTISSSTIQRKLRYKLSAFCMVRAISAPC